MATIDTEKAERRMWLVRVSEAGTGGGNVV